MKISRYGLLVVVALAVILLAGGYLLAAGKTNLINVSILKGREVAAASTCSNIWLAGMQAGQQGDQFVQYQAAMHTLRCSEDYLTLVRAVFPKDRDLAELSTQLYPDSYDAWFWLGEVATSFDKLQARHAYIRTVELAPWFSLAWCRLGYNYEKTGDLDEAFNAFLNCCMRGDPGSHGCYGAGRMMEKMGDIPQAIKYYRLSRNLDILNQADELEKQIGP